MFYGQAHAVSTDKQGRILLSEKHCERAGLSGEVVFVGARSRFEIWSKERHESSTPDSFTTYQHAAEEVGL
jgi:MraZ protein